MNFRLFRVCALLFFSGACALVYQTAWLRELRLIFGASTSASAAVLAIFMGGLGLGGALLGKRADRVKNALAMYANLELVVSVAAALTPLLVMLAQRAYIALGGQTTLGAFGATTVRLLLAVLVLAAPTVAMGGTLPAAARAVERASDVGRQRVAALYGVNTIGAVVGAVAASFFLVEVFGARMTVWLACLVNALVGMTARALSRSEDAASPVAVGDASAAVADPAPEPEPEPEPATAVDGADASRLPISWFPPAAAAISGATFMLMELVWYRMLGPILGGSSYTFGLILAIALAGIGLGGALYSRTRIQPTLAIFAVTCAVEALVIAIPYALGDRIAMLALLLRPMCATGFGASVLAWAVVAVIVVLPAAIVAGAQFPMVIGLYGRGSRSVGRDVGAAYLANTLGAIVGSIAGGFGLLPALSAPGCWKLVVMLLLATAGLAVAVDVKGRGRLALLRGAGASAVACSLLALFFAASMGPTAAWRHSGIGAGRADPTVREVTVGTVPAFVRYHRGRIAWEEDGLESSVALVNGAGYEFVVNGKSDGHALIDSPTQVMSGVLGALLHPEPHRALVVGLGTGSTAGWLGALPSMDRVDVIELEPAILRVAKDCKSVNADVLDNPKVHVRLGDAREALLTTRETYDLIVSEPSNPYRAGISSMYTLEFYRAVSERLRPNGRFLQWVQSYEVDAWCIATTLVTLRQVYPQVSVWRTAYGDLLVVAQQDPAVLDVETIRRRLGEDVYSRATKSAWHTASVEGVLAHFVASPLLADHMVENELGAVNLDDQNVLEFAFARSIGRPTYVDGELQALATRLRADRPRLNGAIDDTLLLEERWLGQLAEHRALEPPPSNVAGPERAFGLFVAQMQADRSAGGYHAWKKLGRTEPRSFFEGTLLAEAATSVDDPDADSFVSAVPSETTRELLRALRAIRQRDVPLAASALERGFTLYRKDPWVRPLVSHAAIDLAVELAATNRDIALRMFAVLGEPFAAEADRLVRLRARATIGRGTARRPCTISSPPSSRSS